MLLSVFYSRPFLTNNILCKNHFPTWTKKDSRVYSHIQMQFLKFLFLIIGISIEKYNKKLNAYYTNLFLL